MREEKQILKSDVEIPEVVLKKTDDALAQIRESTKPVRKAKKVDFRVASAMHRRQPLHVQYWLERVGLPLQQQLFTIYGVVACREISRQRKSSRKTWQSGEW